jgi:hypothetical protein
VSNQLLSGFPSASGTDDTSISLAASAVVKWKIIVLRIFGEFPDVLIHIEHPERCMTIQIYVY